MFHPKEGPKPAQAGSRPRPSFPTIGVNMRITGKCNKGGRKYMEDFFSISYRKTDDEQDMEYAYFGIFDGHGGREAAVFAKDHLMDFIVSSNNFWADDDETVLKAIREGFMQTHQAMWKELEKWPKTASGLPSTAGTTASIAFIRRGKIYVGHVGDSAIVLGVQDPHDPNNWTCQPLTRDHKPESQEESRRIEKSGGKVICKSGVPRVVWNRPRIGHRGPVRRSTHIDEIPFLAVARSLGDLWSYNSKDDVFVVSPEPDTFVYPLDVAKHRCLILGTDGLWNMLTPLQAVKVVCDVEKSNEDLKLNPFTNREWTNPSSTLVDKAIDRWNGNNLRADNTSVVTVMFDPLGYPPRVPMLMKRREQSENTLHNSLDPNSQSQSFKNIFGADRGSVAMVTNTSSKTNEYPLARRSMSSSVSQPNLPSASNVMANKAIVEMKYRGRPCSSMHEASNRPIYPAPNENQLHRNQNDPGPLDHLMRLATATSSRVPFADSTTSCSTLDPSKKSNSGHQDIQCNVVTSSSDDESTPGTALQSKAKKKPAKATTRLSRELQNLRLNSPLALKPVNQTPRRRGGFFNREGDENIENRSASKGRLLRSAKKYTKSATDVEKKCNELNARITSMQRRVAKKTEELNKEVKRLRSTLSKEGERSNRQLKPSKSCPAIRDTVISPPAEPKMILRPRTPGTESMESNSMTGRKRKLRADLMSEPVSKSPRPLSQSGSSQVRLSKPVVTRSRRAKVLQLK